jgi:drug/metabolite transporter (DMT)-like permease
MSWLPLTLLCAFALASSDAAAKRWLGSSNVWDMLLVRLGLAGLLLVPWLLWHPPGELTYTFWGWMALLAPLEVVAMLLYMRAIRDHALSLTLPYMAFTPVFIVASGYLVLGETVSPRGLTGIGLVVAGSWLLNFETVGRLSGRGLLAPFRAILRNPGSRMMLLAACIYALTAAGSKAAMLEVGSEGFGALYFVIVGGFSLLLTGLLRPRSFRVMVEQPGASLLVAALMALMVVTHFLAIAQVEAAYMIAAKRTSLLFGILYGALLFGERHLGRHLVAGGLMVAGVALITL